MRAPLADGLARMMGEAGCGTRRFPLPPASFDPLLASPAQLKAFGLPPRPDARTEPGLLLLWRRMLSPPITFVEPEFGEPIRVRDRPVGRAMPASNTAMVAALGGTTRLQSSLNWSGALIRARDDARFTGVWACWKVPAATRLPPGASETRTPGPTNAYRYSAWIGLDGHLRRSRSLPQLGTTQTFDYPPRAPSGLKTYAWRQWWVRDGTFGEEPLENFLVEPGDEMICSLTVLGPAHVRFHFKNQTKSAMANFESFAGAAEATVESDRPEAPVEGKTAQWIVERPHDPKARDYFPLLNFGTFQMRDCYAQAHGTTGAQQPMLRDLTGARLIRMREARGNRTAVVSVPGKLGSTALQVSYRVVPP